MKNKVIILVSVIVIIAVGLLLGVGIGLFNKSNKIKDLLNEKYGEDFKIVHDNGNEYEGGVIPSFKKTGYKNVIASPVNNKEIKFNVRLKSKPLEIVKDLNFDSNTNGTIRIYSIKDNGIEKIKDYYKNSKDTVKVENSNVSIRRKCFETTNKDYFVNF
ncbi:MAG: hypothetical protein K6B70_07125 [Clostridia bacterium]|nr:hypothetical protein [Clostridia bacterium]